MMTVGAYGFQNMNKANMCCPGNTCEGTEKNAASTKSTTSDDILDSDDDMDFEMPKGMDEIAAEFDNNGTCGMFCQMQQGINATFDSIVNATTGSQEQCIPPAQNGMCGMQEPATTATKDPLPENFEFEQCDMMCQLNNTLSGFANKTMGENSSATTPSDSSDSDL